MALQWRHSSKTTRFASLHNVSPVCFVRCSTPQIEAVRRRYNALSVKHLLAMAEDAVVELSPRRSAGYLYSCGQSVAKLSLAGQQDTCPAVAKPWSSSPSQVRGIPVYRLCTACVPQEPVVSFRGKEKKKKEKKKG